MWKFMFVTMLGICLQPLHSLAADPASVPTSDLDAAVRDATKAIEAHPRSPSAYQRRGENYFRLSRFKESVADFDKVLELAPERGPYLWQRGISLYYAGEFDRGADQFVEHSGVNPNDVENAAWHFLCIARACGLERARSGLLKTGGDSRVPMMRIHALYAGTATPEDVLKEAEAGDVPAADRKQRLFYARLYIGLFYEATGQSGKAFENIALAADKYAADDYMGDVARVHAALLKLKKTPTTQR